MQGTEERKQRLSQKLIAYLAEQGISGNKLGERIKVSQTSAQAYIDGRTFPGEEIRSRIATLLGVSLAELDADLDGRELPRRLTVEDLAREIRLLDAVEFIELLPVVLERVQSQLQSCIR